MNKRTWISCVAVLAISACATSPVPVSQSEFVPKDRQWPDYTEFAVAAPEKAKVIVVRDSGLLGSAIKAKILVDGKAIASLWSSERVEFYLPLGSHILGVVPEPQLGGALQENVFQFPELKTYYFRFSISPTEGAMLRPSTQIAN